MAKGGGPKKRFQHCLNPNSSKHLLYFRAIQGHSGGNLVDLALQDNVLLRDEIYSITRSGLIPGGGSFSRNRQSVFFTAVNPTDDDQRMEEVQYDLDKPRIAPYKNTWRPHQNKVYWCNLKLAQKKGLQFIKHDHTQSFSATHHLRLALRKRCARRRRRSYTMKYVNLQGCLVLC